MSDEQALDQLRFEQESLQQQLEEHMSKCEEYFKGTDQRFMRLIDAQEKNTQAVTELTQKTAGVVDLYQNASGAIKTGIAVQRFGLWLAKWPVVGIGLYATFQWALDRLPG